MMVKTKHWKTFKYQELFLIEKGKRLLDSQKLGGNIPYISSGSINNGIENHIGNGITHKAPFITIASYGSIGQAFYQNKDSWVSDNCNVLHLKDRVLNKEIGLFLVSLIKEECYRYNYGFTAKSSRIRYQKIKLPVTTDGNPNWELIENYMKDLWNKLPSPLIKASHDNKIVSLEDRKWAYFSYKQVFTICDGFYNKKPIATTKGSIPFIGATFSNNGVTSYHDIEDIEAATKTGEGKNHSLANKIFEGEKYITISNDGSVGCAFYQPKDFTCSHSVSPITPKDIKMNPYIAIFLCTIIGLEKFRWDYGRKWRPKRIPHSRIKLPMNQEGKPDWQFMEHYIKSLPYSKNLLARRKHTLTSETR